MEYVISALHCGEWINPLQGTYMILVWIKGLKYFQDKSFLQHNGISLVAWIGQNEASRAVQNLNFETLADFVSFYPSFNIVIVEFVGKHACTQMLKVATKSTVQFRMLGNYKKCGQDTYVLFLINFYCQHWRNIVITWESLHSHTVFRKSQMDK